jgi:hypothetical protein
MVAVIGFKDETGQTAELPWSQSDGDFGGKPDFEVAPMKTARSLLARVPAYGCRIRQEEPLLGGVWFVVISFVFRESFSVVGPHDSVFAYQYVVLQFVPVSFAVASSRKELAGVISRVVGLEFDGSNGVRLPHEVTIVFIAVFPNLQYLLVDIGVFILNIFCI